jgi:DNA-binding transcriptional LysR family regulator
MPFATGPNLEVAPIHQENFLIVVPSSHALGRKSAVRLRETANETYVLYDRAHAPGFHDFVLGILNRAGVLQLLKTPDRWTFGDGLHCEEPGPVLLPSAPVQDKLTILPYRLEGV